MLQQTSISTISTKKSKSNWRDWDWQKKQAFLKKLKAISAQTQNDFAHYRFAPASYIKEKLGYEVWRNSEATCQAHIVEHYALVLKQLHERRDYESGKKAESDLTCWHPGETIQNWISVDAGHNVGKSFIGAALVSHFFDCFAPSITYCFAPTFEQINDLLFKEIRTQRGNKGLPGQVLDGTPQINFTSNHFVKGKATNNSNNSGTERAQGQHGEYLMFVIDEAEGVPSFVFDAVRSMSSGGIAIILILRNPRTTICEAHKIRKQANCKAFRISCLDHPNVIKNREVVPGSVRRQYVDEMLKDCEVVEEHFPDDYTFDYQGKIYRPSLEFLWRVLGIASSKGTDDTFCPPGRYEAACQRKAYEGDDPLFASIGVDAARYGNDKGTVFYRHAGVVRKDCEISKQDSYEYYIKIKKTCQKLKEIGVKRISIRIDAGGGYGSCVDNLKRDADIQEWFESISVHEVHNNGDAFEKNKYANKITELYAYAGEALKALRIETPNSNLEVDLTERKYEYAIKSDGKKTRLDLKILQSKEIFKDKFKRSPDDGDGFVLAVAGEHLFASNHVSLW